MDLQQKVIAFLQEDQKAVILGIDSGTIFFDLEQSIARSGCVEWPSEEAVQIAIGLGEVSPEELAFVVSLPHSPASALVAYDEEDKRLLAWSSTPQQLPKSRVGIRQVLTPIFERAACEIPPILLSLATIKAPPVEGHTPGELVSLLSFPQGHA